ncbi:MAG: NUDIX domain-containing protein [Candidatus Woesearchaeota archaeon]
MTEIDKNQQMIMVVSRERLFPIERFFQGFSPASAVDFEAIILENAIYMKRGDAEGNPAFKQPIGYVLIRHSPTGRIYAYQRASKQAEYHETRLHGKWSWGVGGHIEECEAGEENPILASMLRELREEVGLSDAGDARILGYINNENDPVGEVHFGILYLVETAQADIRPADKESKTGGFKTVQELEEICASPELDVEGWSRIALDALKKEM